MHTQLKKDNTSLQKKSSDRHQESRSHADRSSDLLSGETTEGFTSSPSYALPPPGQGQLVMQCKGLSENSEPTYKSGQLIQRRANNTGLPDKLKTGIENLSGYSMDDVKVHYNSSKPAQLQAYAYTQGTAIHVAFGQEQHLPHEAWHVVQQKQGRVKPTVQMKGRINVNDNAGLEKEADIMGERAARQDMESKGYSNAGQHHPMSDAPSTARCNSSPNTSNNFSFNNNSVVQGFFRMRFAGRDQEYRKLYYTEVNSLISWADNKKENRSYRRDNIKKEIDREKNESGYDASKAIEYYGDDGKRLYKLDSEQLNEKLEELKKEDSEFLEGLKKQRDDEEYYYDYDYKSILELINDFNSQSRHKATYSLGQTIAAYKKAQANKKKIEEGDRLELGYEVIALVEKGEIKKARKKATENKDRAKAAAMQLSKIPKGGTEATDKIISSIEKSRSGKVLLFGLDFSVTEGEYAFINTAIEFLHSSARPHVNRVQGFKVRALIRMWRMYDKNDSESDSTQKESSHPVREGAGKVLAVLSWIAKLPGKLISDLGYLINKVGIHINAFANREFFKYRWWKLLPRWIFKFVGGLFELIGMAVKLAGALAMLPTDLNGIAFILNIPGTLISSMGDLVNMLLNKLALMKGGKEAGKSVGNVLIGLGKVVQMPGRFISWLNQSLYPDQESEYKPVPASHVDVDARQEQTFSLGSSYDIHRRIIDIGYPGFHTDVRWRQGYMSLVDAPVPFMEDRFAYYHPLRDPKKSYNRTRIFDQTMLHEIGHHVDNKFEIMDQHGSEDICGNWMKEMTEEEWREQLAQKYTGRVEEKQKAVNNMINWGRQKWKPLLGGPSIPHIPRYSFSDTTLISKAKPFGGYVGYEAYPDNWVAYKAKARKHKVSRYQWRAPGEWFAEVYASYYTGTLENKTEVKQWFEERLNNNNIPEPEQLVETEAEAENGQQKYEKTLKRRHGRAAKAISDNPLDSMEQEIE